MKDIDTWVIREDVNTERKAMQEEGNRFYL